ncbi:MAG: ATP-binding cassette domain-containing protein, partial [Spirochaetales bacterium]|nr:ATP-binding cassette domain-containing protein [Spirochaetales bacterium]
LVEAITGLRKVEKGTVTLDELVITNLSPRKIRNAGLTHIPEDRNTRGLNRSLSVMENIISVELNQEPFSKYTVIDEDASLAYAAELAEKFDIRPRDPKMAAESLSGGNAQKIVVAREVSIRGKLLIASQPTRGVDIGAIESIRNILEEVKEEGRGVLLVSADLEEILSLSDRIIVMFEGKITGELRTEEANESDLGILMMGGEDKQEVKTNE